MMMMMVMVMVMVMVMNWLMAVMDPTDVVKTRQ
jgi:hypothetical protein